MEGPGTVFTANSTYDLVVKNLTYKVMVKDKAQTETKGKVILDNVTAEARHGELLAIFGPSGSGKTTLLDALAGRIDKRSLAGDLLVNGKFMDHKFKRISGYVTQDDALFPLLTVRETLLYSARLRLRGSVTYKEKEERVELVMQQLGLGSCANTRVGNDIIRGVSGGERRRVSIGVDVIHDPAVLLLDEPTSGLDSTSALQVMKHLSTMAKQHGRTIILTIHQPGYSVLETIHNCLVLVQGNVIYHGCPVGMINYFADLGYTMPEHMTTVEYFLKTISECRGQPDGLIKLVEYHIVGALVMGSLFFNVRDDYVGLHQRESFFGFSLSFVLFTSSQTLPLVLWERQIFIRETTRGAYSTSAYVLAGSLVILPFLLVLAGVFSCISYPLVGLAFTVPTFLFFYLVYFVVLAAANSFVTCIAGLLPDLVKATIVLQGCLSFFFLFSGYFIERDAIPKWWLWIHYLSLHKYPYEALMKNELSQYSHMDWDQNMVAGLSRVDKWLNVAILVVFFLAYRMIYYLHLLWTHKHTRK